MMKRLVKTIVACLPLRGASPFPVSRSQALVQVLVMSLLMAILASALIKSVVHQSFLAKKNIDSSEKIHSAQTVVMAVMSVWTQNGGQVCSDGSFRIGGTVTADVACGTPGVCGCTCAVSIAAAPVTTDDVPGSNYCQIKYSSVY